MSRNVGILKIKRLEEDPQTGIRFWITEKLIFNIDCIEEYKKKFAILKERGYVVGGDFEDDIWLMSDKKENELRSNIEFHLGLNTKIKMVIKSYAIEVFSKKNESPSNLRREINLICDIANKTSNFSINSVGSFDDYVRSMLIESNGKIDSSIRLLSSKINSFLSFYQPQYAEEYIKILNRRVFKCGRKRIPTSSRHLPPFEDIIEFNEYVDDFFYNGNIIVKYYLNGNYDEYCRLRNKYLPINIWWHLTLIIPMRPGEFVRLKSNCNSYDEKNNKYFIDIPRIKNFQNTSNLRVNTGEIEIQKIRITKEIYILIEEYKNLHPSSNEKFLFNHNTHVIYVHTFGKGASKKKPYNKKILNLKRFQFLLISFYRDIIKNIYGKDYIVKKRFKLPELIKDNDMVKLSVGDTRHLAISSLLEYGENPLIIAELAHHDKLKSQMSYINYFDKYAVIKAKKIAEKLSIDFKQQANNLAKDLDIDYSNLKGEIALSDSKVRIIKEGICTNEEAPFACGSIDCFFCKSCIPVVNKDNINYMDNLVKKYHDEILKQIKNIQGLMQNLISLITKDSIQLKNGTITGNKRYVQEYQTQISKSVSLQHKLARVILVRKMLNIINIEEDNYEVK